MDQTNSKNTDAQKTACSVILNIWVRSAILKTKVLSISLFLRCVLVESRTCFWSFSIRFCCVILPLFVSAVKTTKHLTSEIISQLAGSLSNVWSWLKNISETIVELHSEHKTHITAVQPSKPVIQILHIHTHSHTHTHTHTKKGKKEFTYEGCWWGLSPTTKETSYSDQTPDLFNLVPTNLNTLLSPLL